MLKILIKSETKLNFSWIVGLVFLLYICTCLISGLSNSRGLIHPISMLYIFISYGIVLLMNSQLNGFIKLITMILFRSKIYKMDDIQSASNAVRLLEKSTYLIGATGFLIGLCATLNQLDVPSMIGPNIAMSILSVLYSAIFMLVIVIPGKTFVDNRIQKNKI